MKFNEEMFEKIRAATKKLLTDGPATATVAIQQALHKGDSLTYAVPHPGWNAPQSRPMRDITPSNGTQAIDIANMVETATADDFSINLLTRLRMPSGLQVRPPVLPTFSPAEFQAPSSAPQPEDASNNDQFISGFYRNQVGSRNYKLYIPSSYHGEALPLVVMLHGCTQDPDDFATGTRMNAIAEERQCFVVYPAQTQSANNARCWNWFKATDQQRDQGEPSIIADITRHIISTQHIDASRVYIAGMSAGGGMAVIMSTLYPDLYAAVGVHSGLPYASAHDLPSALAAMKGGAPGHRRGNGSTAGATARPSVMPIIVFHGDQDTTVHPRNGERLMAQNGPQTMSQDAQHGKVSNGHAYTRTTHQNAQGQIIAEHWLIHGAAHAWSGGSKRGTYTDVKGPDASQEMMRFFYMQTKKL